MHDQFRKSLFVLLMVCRLFSRITGKCQIGKKSCLSLNSSRFIAVPNTYPLSLNFSSIDPGNTTPVSNTKIYNNMVRTCETKTASIHIAAFTCMIVMIPITLIGNGLVITVLFKCPKLRKQTTYTFLMSLAFADMLVGLFTIPLRAKKSWNNNLFCVPEYLCWFFNLAEIMFSIVSVVHLLAIGIDRYFSLRYVYLYEQKVTRKKLYIVITCLWMYSLVITLLSTFQWDNRTVSQVHTPDKQCYWKNKPYYYFVLITTFYIPLPILIFNYIYVYRIAKRHIDEILKTTVGSASSKKDLTRKKKQLKLLRSVMVLLLVYIICWIPNTIFQMSLVVNESFWRPKTQEKWFIAIYFVLVFVLAPLNSAINPWIYVIVNDQFRFFLKQLILKLRNKPCMMNDTNALTSASKSITMHKISETCVFSNSHLGFNSSVSSMTTVEGNLTPPREQAMINKSEQNKVFSERDAYEEKTELRVSSKDKLIDSNDTAKKDEDNADINENNSNTNMTFVANE